MMSNDVPTVTGVTPEEAAFIVHYSNGFRLYVPYERYKRLREASPVQRQHLTFNPKGIHWPDVDEDLSGVGLLQDALKPEA